MKARQQESKDVVFNEVREANKRPIVPSCGMVEVIAAKRSCYYV